jgi:hypothetical protein
MKFLHLSDLHIGKSVYDFKMYDEVVGVAVLGGIGFLVGGGFMGF